MDKAHGSRLAFSVKVAASCAVAGLVDGLATALGQALPLFAYPLLGAVFGGLTWWAARRRAPSDRTLAALLGGAFVVSLAWWPLGTRKVFLRDARAISIGMTRADVEAHMHPYPMVHPNDLDSPSGNLWSTRSDLWISSWELGASVLVRFDDDERVRAVEVSVD